MSDDFPQEFLELIKQIWEKRSKIVVEHILEHGYITTEELKSLYDYKHPPRAIRDVRENIAMRNIRRLEIIWRDSEIRHYQWLKNQADKMGQSLAEYIKNMIVGLYKNQGS